MAINKKLIHFGTFSNFNSQKLSANKDNTAYTIGIEGSVVSGEPNILFESIVFIKDVKKIWTHAEIYDCNSPDLSGYLTSEEIAEVYATKTELSPKINSDGNIQNIVKVTELPSSPDANTLYVVVKS